MEIRVKQIEEQIVKTEEESKQFSDHVAKEVEQWRKMRDEDIQSEIRGLVEREAQFWDRGFEIWDALIHRIEDKMNGVVVSKEEQETKAENVASVAVEQAWIVFLRLLKYMHLCFIKCSGFLVWVLMYLW